MGDGEQNTKVIGSTTTHLGALSQQQDDDKTTRKGTLEFNATLPWNRTRANQETEAKTCKNKTKRENQIKARENK